MHIQDRFGNDRRIDSTQTAVEQDKSFRSVFHRRSKSKIKKYI